MMNVQLLFILMTSKIQKEDLLEFIDDSIKIKSEPMQSSLQSILAV